MNDAELTFHHEWGWDQRRHQHAAGDDKICREDGWHWCQSFWKVSGCSWIEFRKGTEDWNIEQSNTFYIVQVANSLVGQSGFKLLLSAMLLRWDFSMTKSVLLTAMPVSNDIADTLLFLSWRLKISWIEWCQQFFVLLLTGGLSKRLRYILTFVISGLRLS